MPRDEPETAASARLRGIRIARVPLLVLLAIAAIAATAVALRACRPAATSLPPPPAAATPPRAATGSGAGGGGSGASDSSSVSGSNGASGFTGAARGGGATGARRDSSAGGAVARERRTLSRSFATAGVRRLLLDFPPGPITFESGAGELAQVTVEAECEPGCAAAARLRLGSHPETGGTLRLYLDGWPQGAPWSRPPGGLREQVHVRAPRGLAIGADLGPCSLELSRLDGPWSLASAGLHLRVAAPETSIGVARLATGWGDTALLTSLGRRRGAGLLGSDVAWQRSRPGPELGVECVFGSVELAIAAERPPRLPPAIRRP
jgi:hypothetical protein